MCNDRRSGPSIEAAHTAAQRRFPFRWFLQRGSSVCDRADCQSRQAMREFARVRTWKWHPFARTARRVSRRTTSGRGPPRRGGFATHVAKQLPDRLLQVLAMDDGVDHPVLQEKLGSLEPLGKILADRLLDDARSRK